MKIHDNTKTFSVLDENNILMRKYKTYIQALIQTRHFSCIEVKFVESRSPRFHALVSLRWETLSILQ